MAKNKHYCQNIVFYNYYIELINQGQMKCYGCPAELSKKNQSEEHIIPNFLGGRLSSHNLLCNACNSKFGETIDKELFRQLGFAADTVVKGRDREKRNVRVMMETISGQKVAVGQGLNPKPKLTIKIPGQEKLVEIFAKDDDDLRRLAAVKMKELKKKYGEFTLTEKVEGPIHEKVHFKNDISLEIGTIGFGGTEYFRAITKIMLNFYLLRKPGARILHDVLDFVNGKNKETPTFIYHPTHYKVCDHGEKEFSHILYLRGEKEERSVYCYLELFNFEKFLCVLDNNYSGADFSFTYCYDLIAEKELKKEITIQINKYQLQDLKFISQFHKAERVKAFNEFEKRIELLQLEQFT